MVTTTDFPFATLAAWGAAVANPGHLLKQPPNFDQPHDLNARMPFTMVDYPAKFYTSLTTPPAQPASGMTSTRSPGPVTTSTRLPVTPSSARAS